jgi:hypothetical protein
MTTHMFARTAQGRDTVHALGISKSLAFRRPYHRLLSYQCPSLKLLMRTLRGGMTQVCVVWPVLTKFPNAYKYSRRRTASFSSESTIAANARKIHLR